MPTARNPVTIVTGSRDPRSLLFSRWYDDVIRGKYVVVVVVIDQGPSARAWIVTAYMAQRITGGTLEWAKS